MNTKPPQLRKLALLTIRVRAADLRTLKASAARVGMKFSAYVRSRLGL